MASYLKEKLGDKLSDSVYAGWINENGSFSSAQKLAVMIEKYRAEFAKDEKKTQEVFLTALKHEVAFFDSVGKTY
jgi:thiaminase